MSTAKNHVTAGSDRGRPGAMSRSFTSMPRSLAFFSCLVLALTCANADALNEAIDPNNRIDSLKKIAVPGPTPEELAQLVQDKRAAIQLGKALFWDVRVGSDNRTACATCHFASGVDHRIRNQLGPGLIAGDRSFQLGGPNYTLRPDDFPFTRHADVNDAASRFADINDIVSSQGVLTKRFVKTSANAAEDKCIAVSDAVYHGGTGFNVNGVNTRRTEPRNTPSVINAVFNFRNFWDGRANNMFNGGDALGLRNPDQMVWKVEHGILRPVRLVLPSSSLASLGVGPPLSSNEMSCMGRTMANLGRKLANSYFLWDQAINPRDSVLAPYADYRTTYGQLIRQAFRPEFWSSHQPVVLPSGDNEPARTMDLPASRVARGDRTASGSATAAEYGNSGGTDGHRDARNRFSQMEANFATFFGLALQLYQATLVADDTPFDRFKEGDSHALNAQQKRGLTIFTGAQGNCFRCHAGPALTTASFDNITRGVRLGSRPGANNTTVRFDPGFFNIGVRPSAEDPGLGGVDPGGNPLSETRMSQLGRGYLLGNDFLQRNEPPVPPDANVAVDGAFKTPNLRNVEFTGPYFHNGGKSTLMQVVDFYNRGGDFSRENQPLSPLAPLGLTQAQKDDLVAFMLSLSDERVRFQRAPFDHPSICIPEGHAGDHRRVYVDRRGDAIDLFRCLGATGAGGSRTPLDTFLSLNPFER